MEKASEGVRIVYHPLYLTPYSTAGCESPERVQSIAAGLKGKYRFVEPQPCADSDILLCHAENLLITEKTAKDRYEAARMAVGGAIHAARLALEGYIAFGLVRPPGHHANPDHNWGFCFFNNMAIAIKKLKSEGLIKTAVILDIDLHFGDGTDAIFRGSREVRVLNIQSSTPEAFLSETRSSLDDVPSADIIAVSAGFDQYELDWGANLSTDNYREIGRIAGKFAREKTNGRIFALLEGGYYIPDLGKNTEALLLGMVEGRGR